MAYFKIIFIVLILWLLIFPVSSKASVVEFEVDPGQQHNKIEPIWDILNLWSPSFLVDNNGNPVTWHRDTHPFVNRVILMTATGGRPDYPQLEILKKDSLGNLVYDFANFDSYLSSALYNRFKPIVVFGAIPFVLAPENYHIGVFGSITDPPTDYNKWYEFVKTLISHCVEKFALTEVKTWQWRLYTEPDNLDWWSGTKDEYFKFYDYTAAAALDVVPDIIIGPGNMLGNIEDHWGTDFIDHAMTGTNYYTGRIGSYFKFFTISAYEKCVKHHPPLKEFEYRVQIIKEKLQQYGALDTIAIGFDEGQLITDENDVYLWLGDGTEYGASWQAAYHILGIREGFERIVHWGFTSDGVKTPKYNMIEMLEKMKGETRIDMQLVADSRTLLNAFMQKIDGIASLADDGSSIKIFIYSHHKYRYPHPTITEDPFPVQITVKNIPFMAEKVRLTHWIVDSTHSNYFNKWLEDSKDLPRVSFNGTGGSIYDAGVNSNFNQEGHIFWWNHKPDYLKIDDLEKFATDTTLSVESDGSLNIDISMRPHQVSLLVIRADSTTRVNDLNESKKSKKIQCRIFPNPFNSAVTFELKQMADPGDILIYNVNGQLIRSIKVKKSKEEKSFAIKWDGKNDIGDTVPSGIYLVRFLIANKSKTQKVTILR